MIREERGEAQEDGIKDALGAPEVSERRRPKTPSQTREETERAPELSSMKTQKLLEPRVSDQSDIQSIILLK